MRNKTAILLFMVTAFIISIGVFNYAVDVYCVFNKDNRINILGNIEDNPYIAIKLKKNHKYDYVLIGNSTSKILYLDLFNPKIANIAYPSAKITDIKNVLCAYLDMHPETKTVILPLDLVMIGTVNKKNIASYSGKNLNINEIFRLFYHPKTTIQSIKKLINNKDNQDKYSIYLKKIPLRKQNKDDFEKRGMSAYSEIFKELKKRNINIICYTPPYPAYGLYYFCDLYGLKQIENLKKFIVENNGYLIDFAIINKHTNQPLSKQAYLFSDIVHPKIIWGYFVYGALFDRNFKNDDLYVILNKDNIELNLTKQKQELDNWYKKNKDEYNNFLNINSKPKTYTITPNEIPIKYREIIEKLESKNCY